MTICLHWKKKEGQNVQLNKKNSKIKRKLHVDPVVSATAEELEPQPVTSTGGKTKSTNKQQIPQIPSRVSASYINRSSIRWHW